MKDHAHYLVRIDYQLVHLLFLETSLVGYSTRIICDSSWRSARVEFGT
jgi:hypothetical protein